MGDQDVEMAVEGCVAEASAGASLMQTARGTVKILPDSHGHFGMQVNLHIDQPAFWKIALIGATLLVVGGVLCIAWYKSWWLALKSVFHEGDQGTESADLVPRRSRSGNADSDSDSSAGDWHPLKGLSALGVGKEEAKTDDEADDIWSVIDKGNTSWQLLLRILGALAQVWGMLALMYWSLLTKDEELMDCLAHPHGRFVGHLCTYTHACLRGFPILAANVTLVLLIRNLVQNRIYYSMLHLGYVLHFSDTHILHSQWPGVFLFSMVQGGAHLLLKQYFDPEPVSVQMILNLLRTFVVPGAIFFSFFVRYAEIEGTLMPLNRLIEQCYTKDDQRCHVLSQLKALNERVLSFDSRHRDVVGDAYDAIGKPPALSDVFQNIIDTYETASRTFYNTRSQRWGFFRSLWPAAVLVDSRLDRKDPKTRSWLWVFVITLGTCLVVCFFSVCFFVSSTYRNVLLAWAHQKQTQTTEWVTETLLANAVLLFHALLVLFFLHRTIRGMFYFEIHTGEVNLVNRL